MNTNRIKTSIGHALLALGFAACLVTPALAQNPPPSALPESNLAQHDFFYAGESKVEQMFIVRGGKIAWSYVHPAQGEISDASLLPNGNILFAHQHGVTIISPDKQVVWNYDAPTNTEIHTAQAFGQDQIWFIVNGDPPRLVIANTKTGKTTGGFDLPCGNPKSTHGQFRHARLTEAGTLLVAHMDMGKVVEYDLTGKALWSLPVPGVWGVAPLKNGHVLVTSNKGFVHEVDREGKTVWEWTSADAPDAKMNSLQLASRLPNGNTIINTWYNQWSAAMTPNNGPVQAIEVTPDKKVVWTLRSWTPPAALGPATTIQILDAPAAQN